MMLDHDAYQQFILPNDRPQFISTTAALLIQTGVDRSEASLGISERSDSFVTEPKAPKSVTSEQSLVHETDEMLSAASIEDLSPEK
jgi:hypothetical protein